jgi:meso-butanediol dehydrogenase / (S,S)-butanediol dehydrogenase / diacetyl reductase
VRLDGKVAVISGGGSGIGAATARRFTQEGASVVVTGRRPEPIEAVAAAIGGLAVPGDAANPDHARDAVGAAIDAFGGLDILVVNHGTGSGGSPGTMTDEAWRATLDSNLTGSLNFVRAAIAPMSERGGGSIVLISSVAGMTAFPGEADYSVTKAAMIALARSIAVDHATERIRANVVCPGWVHTPMADSTMERLTDGRGVDRAGAYEMVTRSVPARRAAEPEEIAACILFLASDEASFVNAAVLVADGGGQALDVSHAPFLEWDAP